jgi:hypothetical protein
MSFMPPEAGGGTPAQKTDQNGRFDLTPSVNSGLPAGALLLARLPEEGLVGTGFPDKAAGPVEIVLARGAYLTAKVGDTSGQPLAGVEVCPSFAKDREHSGGLPSARSDEQGRLVLGPLPAGKISLELDPRQIMQTVDDSWDHLSVIVHPGDRKELPPLTLNPQGITVSGVVVDAQQKPVAGALVYGSNFLFSAGVTEADAEGHFRLSGLPPRGSILLAVDPLQPLFAVAEFAPQGPALPPLCLRPLGAITGQVVDEAGKAMTGVRVYISEDSPAAFMGIEWGMDAYERLAVAGGEMTPLNGKPYQDPTSDQEGKWKLTGLLPGKYLVKFGAYRDDYPDSSATAEIKGGDTVDVGRIVLRGRPAGER